MTGTRSVAWQAAGVLVRLGLAYWSSPDRFRVKVTDEGRAVAAAMEEPTDG